uniref:Uncharacterized protein n=1 Tax=Arundo donax TaxID=35708 RepID=A0A0A9H5I2_ARUDO
MTGIAEGLRSVQHQYLYQENSTTVNPVASKFQEQKNKIRTTSAKIYAEFTHQEHTRERKSSAKVPKNLH